MENQAYLAGIKARILSKEITYSEGKTEAMPILAEINNKVKEISKKYGRRPVYLSFEKAMR